MYRQGSGLPVLATTALFTRLSYGFVLVLTLMLALEGCGVKGPPLPPIPDTPQKSEPRPERGSPQPLQSANPTE